MWELDHKEDWVLKNWCFELWCWRRLLRVPWTARRSNQSILKEISPKCSLEGLMLKLKLQYFGYLMLGANSLEKTLMLGRTVGKEEKGMTRGQDYCRFNRHEFAQGLGVGDGSGSLVCCNPWGRRVRHDWATKQEQSLEGLDFNIPVQKFLLFGVLRWEGARKTCLWLLDRQIKNVYFRALKFCK